MADGRPFPDGNRTIAQTTSQSFESADSRGNNSRPSGRRDEDVTVREESASAHIRYGQLLASLVGLALLLLTYWSWLPSPDRSPFTFVLRELGKALLVGVVVSILMQQLVDRYKERLKDRLENFIREDLTDDIRATQDRIDLQTRYLIDASSSLEALNRLHLRRVYGSRGDLFRDLEDTLQRSDLTKIWLMGISLNEFVRTDQRDSLHAAWKVISSYIHGSRFVEEGKSLDIRILILDPHSFGGRLRSWAETREPDELAGRLDHDVGDTARKLNELAIELQKDPDPRRSRVSFEFRLYHVAPTLFMCHTDIVSYVQPYHFWSKRDMSAALPVLQIDGGPGLDGRAALHAGVENHFQAIWNNASSSGSSWLAGSCAGIDLGAHESGLVNIFVSHEQARDRMKSALVEARHDVYIQGISLHSFFDRGELFAAMRELLGADDRTVSVKVLLLDPESAQARYRSFREHEFLYHCNRHYDTADEYLDASCHVDMPLYRDTGGSIRTIAQLRQGAGAQIDARLYDSAPSCFMLMVDDRMFVEQYHYGKVVPVNYSVGDGIPPILGKDMPLLEYASSGSVTDELFEQDPLRNPFDLLKSHFEFVFDRCSKNPGPMSDEIE